MRNSYVKKIIKTSFAMVAFLAPSVVFSTDATVDVDYTLYELKEANGVISLVGTAYTSYTYDSDTYTLRSEETSALVAEASTTYNYVFAGNYVSGTGGIHGGAITNTATSVSFNGVFIGNYTESTNSNSTSGVIYPASGSVAINADFYGNRTVATKNASGGVAFVAAATTITNITGDFFGNYAYAASAANGGVFYNGGTISNVEGNFFGNYAIGATAFGGAVSNTATGTIEFIATTKDTAFLGNYTSTDSGVTKTSNAIYNLGTVEFNTYNSKTISVYDGINGATNGSTTGLIKINSDTDGGANSTVAFYNTVDSQTITVYAGTLLLDSAQIDNYLGVEGITTVSASISNSSITLSSGATLILGDGVSFSSNTWDISSGTVALDLEDVFGGFSVELDFSADSAGLTAIQTLLEAGSFDIVIDDVYYDIVYSDGTYSVSDDSGISDFSISEENGILTFSGAAVPEPSTYAMIIGVLALGFAYYRRRK